MRLIFRYPEHKRVYIKQYSFHGGFIGDIAIEGITRIKEILYDWIGRNLFLLTPSSIVAYNSKATKTFIRHVYTFEKPLTIIG